MINVPRLRHGNGLHESGNQIEIKINEIIIKKCTSILSYNKTGKRLLINTLFNTIK